MVSLPESKPQSLQRIQAQHPEVLHDLVEQDVISPSYFHHCGLQMVDTSLDNKAFTYRGFSAVTILPPRSLLHPPLTPIQPSDRSEHAGHWITSGNSWYPFVLVASYSFSFQMLIAVCDYISDEFCNMQTVSSLRADTGAFSQHHCIIPGNCLAHGTAWRISGIQKHVLNE